MVSTDDAEPRCPHCIGPLGPNDDFCKSCGGPVTSHASIDPLGQIYATGYAYRQAVSGRPSKIVVLGMWLIFGPQLLGAVSLLIVMLQGAVAPQASAGARVRTGWEWSQLLIVVGLIAIYGTILGKVTRRYWRPVAEPADADLDRAGDDRPASAE